MILIDANLLIVNPLDERASGQGQAWPCLRLEVPTRLT